MIMRSQLKGIGGAHGGQWLTIMPWLHVAQLQNCIVPENTRKLLRTQEDTMFSKSLSNGEHWTNKRFLEFTRVCC